MKEIRDTLNSMTPEQKAEAFREMVNDNKALIDCLVVLDWFVEYFGNEILEDSFIEMVHKDGYNMGKYIEEFETD